MTGDDPRIGAGLIDTNVVILLGDLNPEVLPDEPVISAITIAELSVGPLVTDNSKTRVSRQAHLQQAVAAQR